MLTSRAPRAFGLLVAAGLALAACSDNSGSNTEGDVTRAEAAYVIDVEDPRQVAGFADAIFVGTVVEQVATTTRIAIPETQFTVDVSEVLAGEVADTVVVNQQGGVDPSTGETVLLEEDPLIQVGRTYLLATRYNAELDFYTLVPQTGHEELPASNGGNNRQAEPDAVTQMREAIANAIPYDEPRPRVTAPQETPQESITTTVSEPTEESSTGASTPSVPPR